MKQEINDEFDFSKKTEKETKKENKISVKTLKNLRFVCFLIIGGFSIGSGLSITNSFMKNYLINKSERDKLVKVETEKREVEYQKVSIQLENENYDIWIKNKKEILENYDSQLHIYDKAYKNSIQAVKTGVTSLENLDEVRRLYQKYKHDINDSINFINKNTLSFEIFKLSNKETKNLLEEELNTYQIGSLKRDSELESAFLKGFNQSSTVESKEEKERRIEQRDNMIFDISDIMKSDNITTSTKKLKR